MIICPYCNHVISYTVAVPGDYGRRTTLDRGTMLGGQIRFKILCPNCGRYIEI